MRHNEQDVFVCANLLAQRCSMLGTYFDHGKG